MAKIQIYFLIITFQKPLFMFSPHFLNENRYPVAKSKHSGVKEKRYSSDFPSRLSSDWSRSRFTSPMSG